MSLILTFSTAEDDERSIEAQRVFRLVSGTFVEDALLHGIDYNALL